jgi:hypothetical protein
MPSREQVAEAVRSVQRRHDMQAPLNHVNTVEWVDALMPLFEQARNEALEEAAAELEARQVAVWSGAIRRVRALKTGGGGSSG